MRKEERKVGRVKNETQKEREREKEKVLKEMRMRVE